MRVIKFKTLSFFKCLREYLFLLTMAMKKTVPITAILFLTLTFCFLVSCKKEVAVETTYLIKVKEYKTNTPLQGVLISLYKCSNYDNVFGCMSTSVFATHSTDDKGEYAFTQQEYAMLMKIILSKSGYWTVQAGGQGEHTMVPDAWIKISLKASKVYPDTSIFQIQTITESGASNFQSFKSPKDSIMDFKLAGNEINKISWIIYTKDTKCRQYCILDTLASGSLSVNPNKFETLTGTIDY